MYPILHLVDLVINLFLTLLFVWALLSWLFAFNVLSRTNRPLLMVEDYLSRLIDPALRPIRRIVPRVGGIDISPIVLFLALIFLRDVLFDAFAYRAYS